MRLPLLKSTNVIAGPGAAPTTLYPCDINPVTVLELACGGSSTDTGTFVPLRTGKPFTQAYLLSCKFRATFMFILQNAAAASLTGFCVCANAVAAQIDK